MSTALLSARSRGGVLLRAVIAAMVLGLAAVLVFVTAIRVPAQTPGPGWIRGAARSVIRAQGVVLVEEAHAFLVDTGGAIPLAVSTRSPQLGETVIYCRTSGWFEDPMHGSKFDPLGRYTVGPAPRGLDRFAVRVLDGVAWIDSAAVTPGPPRGSPTTAPAGAFCAT